MPEFKGQKITLAQADAINKLHASGKHATDAWLGSDGTSLYVGTANGDTVIGTDGQIGASGAQLSESALPAAEQKLAPGQIPASASNHERAVAEQQNRRAGRATHTYDDVADRSQPVRGEQLSVKTYTAARNAGWEPGQVLPADVALRAPITESDAAA